MRPAHLFRAVLALAAAPVLLGQLARVYPAFDSCNALLAPVLALLALLLLLSLIARDWRAVAIAVPALLMGALQLAASGDGLPGEGADEGDRLRIVTLSTWHDNPDPAALVHAVEAQSPDILLLQESDGTVSAMVDRLLPGYFRVKSCPAAHCSEIILSRWPLHRITLPAPAGSPLPDLLAVRVDAPFGPLHVVNVHLPRPGRDMAVPFRNDLLGTIAALGPARLIVAGDFNLGTGSLALAAFTRHAGLRRIEGFVPTYPANLPIPAFVAIDHMFVGEGWTRARCHRLNAHGSDHYGLTCDLD